MMPTPTSVMVVNQAPSTSVFPPPSLPSTVEHGSKSSASSFTQDLTTMQSSTTAPSFAHNSYGIEHQQEFRDSGLLEVRLSSSSPQPQEEPAWYDAYLIDVTDTPPKAQDGSDSVIAMATVVLAIEGEQPEETMSTMQNVHKVPLEQVRLKSPIGGNLAENDHVEVRTVLENKLITWKMATIKKMRRDFVAVEFEAADTSSSGDNDNSSPAKNLDIASIEAVRLPSSIAPFSSVAHPFYRITFPFSADMLKSFNNDFKWLSDFNLHREFKTHLNHIAVHFDRKSNSLVCLGYAPSIAEKVFFQMKAQNSSKLLISFHLNRLVDLYGITAGLEHRLANDPKEFCLKLKINEYLVGLAIGKSGQNIQKARNLPGVKMVEYDEDEKAFIIRADSIELCKKAASIVNYSEITMYFDYDELKDFFNDRDLIQGIVTSSQMYYVHIDTVLGDDDDHGENEDGADHGQQPPLLHRIKLIGTVDSIEAFQFLLAYQMHEWREIVALKTKLAELYQQILANQNSHNGLPFSMCVPQQQQQRQHQQTSKQSSPQQQQLHSYPQPLVLNMANAERGQFFHKSLSPKNFAEAVKANMR